MAARFLAFALLVACTRPTDAVVICHNANCAGAPTSADDTLPELAASLALVGELADGIEIDLVWSADGRCVFAHDLDAAELPDASEAVHFDAREN
jgi:glycerophosphoryl diester phosphodiesterase